MGKQKWTRAAVVTATLAGMLGVTGAATAAEAVPGCQVTVSKSQFDYGRFTRRALDAQPGPDGDLVAGRQMATINVTCAEPRRVALFFRGAVSADGTAFRFGDQGKVRLRLWRAQADGQPVQIGQGDAGMPAVAWGEQAWLAPDRGVVIQGGRPLSRLTVQMEALATLPAMATATGTAQRLAGSGRIEVQTY
ncbi:hypothetical protein [Cupriavidus lacunae]|uniref:DUF1120 domain-containing protein n=1 Tax=Cupriavidus lacunae TaxID=2666307 RepID=A0A370NKT4_9BURK|nr:hypothetical protein [Cupriavidus lacunae]RDK06212.1 hypothetical protein DN412_32815 [Cupriavidus lacunae]